MRTSLCIALAGLLSVVTLGLTQSTTDDGTGTASGRVVHCCA